MVTAQSALEVTEGAPLVWAAGAAARLYLLLDVAHNEVNRRVRCGSCRGGRVDRERGELRAWTHLWVFRRAAAARNDRPPRAPARPTQGRAASNAPLRHRACALSRACAPLQTCWTTTRRRATCSSVGYAPARARACTVPPHRCPPRPIGAPCAARRRRAVDDVSRVCRQNNPNVNNSFAWAELTSTLSAVAANNSLTFPTQFELVECVATGRAPAAALLCAHSHASTSAACRCLSVSTRRSRATSRWRRTSSRPTPTRASSSTGRC